MSPFKCIKRQVLSLRTFRKIRFTRLIRLFPVVTVRMCNSLLRHSLYWSSQCFPHDRKLSVHCRLTLIIRSFIHCISFECPTLPWIFPLPDIPPPNPNQPNPNPNPNPNTNHTNPNPTDPILTILTPLLTLTEQGRVRQECQRGNFPGATVRYPFI